MDQERIDKLINFLNKHFINYDNLEIINQAFYHSSYINENSDAYQDNEKLEFLGDAVLALITVEYLYKSFPKSREGELSRIKSLLVSATTLSQFAKKINLSDYLLLGKGEAQSGGYHRVSLLADTFEALLGAIYLDTGIEEVRQFIIPMLKEYICKIERMEHVRDYKTCFQLYVQQKFKTIPKYETVKEIGPDHSKLFYVHVYINSKICGQGKGKSKKIAQQSAAKEAIENMGLEDHDESES